MPPDVPQQPPVEETPLHRRSAFKAWWKSSAATLGAALVGAASGTISWRVAMLGASAFIAKEFLFSSYEILFGEPDSSRPV